MNGAQNTHDVMEILAPPASSEALSRLHRLLESKAERDGVLDVAYTVVDSPVGRLMLAATTRGLVRVAYATEDHDRVLETLAQKLSPRVLRAPQRLDAAARELEEYFTRRRQAFRPSAGSVAVARIPPAGAAASARDRLWPDPQLPADR